jgi:hypothetical protein
MSSLVVELLEMGLSKYRIAKSCKVHWNTVNAWARGYFEPSEKNKYALTDLLLSEKFAKAKS